MKLSKATRAGLARKLLEETKADAATSKEIENNETIDATNYRRAAHSGVKKYFDLGMIVDAMFWRHITGLYEAEITELQKKVAQK